MISKNPTAEERVQYEAWLQEANQAHHKLMLGASEVSVGANGESVTFKPANKTQLENYINQLRRALGKSATSNPAVSFKPVVFGSR